MTYADLAKWGRVNALRADTCVVRFNDYRRAVEARDATQGVKQ